MIDKFNKAMQVFKEHFSPAASFEESDERMTTEDIFDKFFELSHDKSLKIAQIQELMEKNGFRFDYYLDGFVWPLKIIHPQENA